MKRVPITFHSTESLSSLRVVDIKRQHFPPQTRKVLNYTGVYSFISTAWEEGRIFIFTLSLIYLETLMKAESKQTFD